MKDLIIEALVVGVVTVIVGTLVSWGLGKRLSVDLPPVCKEWNKFYVMEVSLFLTGVFAHLLFEFIGANKWYARSAALLTFYVHFFAFFSMFTPTRFVIVFTDLLVICKRKMIIFTDRCSCSFR